MRTVEEVREDIDACFENLSHLCKINSQWREVLPNIDPVTRPLGFSNQQEGIKQQEDAFISESKRLIILKAEEWLASISPLEINDLEEIKAIHEAKDGTGSALFD